MGILDKPVCENADGQRSVNATNMTLSDCLDDTDSVMAFGGAFVGDVTRYGVFTIALLFGLLTVLGNAVIIGCVVISRHLNLSNYSVYVVSLAISDLLVGVMCIPAISVYTLYGYWPLGSGTCTVFLACDFVCTSTSNIHLVVIAYDRFRAVANPLQYRSQFTKARARRLAAVAWLQGAGYYIPVILIVRIPEELRGTSVPNQCYYPANIFYLIGLVPSIYGPSACLIVMYFFLYVILRRRHASHKSTSQLNEHQLSYSSRADLGHVNSTEREKIRGQNRRCILTLLAQVVLFLICWGPWMVVFPVSKLCESCVPSAVFDISYWMAYLNSTVNPVLYLIFNKDYRNVFLSLFSHSKAS